MIGRLAALAAAALLLAAAAPPDLAQLEQARDAKPNDAKRRQALAFAYYEEARRAFDEARYDAYQGRLGQAVDEAVEAVRLAPDAAEPHSLMGLMSIYQGSIRSAFVSFANARRLAPRRWSAYTDLIECMVYKGTPRRDIEPWLDRAERLGAVTAVVDLNLVLVTWRDGDLEAAERHWRRVMRLGPEVLHYWNGVKLDTPIETLPDLMAHCCAEASCGRYLAEACQDANLAVAQREIPTEVARRELLIEMERRRKLDEIYSKRRDLEIEVEPPEVVP